MKVRSFERPDAVQGRTRLVELPRATIGLAVFEPGWRWSVHTKPRVGGDSCRTAHVGYLIAGRLGVLMDDGTAAEIGAGDAFDIEPGHDAWVIGDEPCTFVEFFRRD